MSSTSKQIDTEYRSELEKTKRILAVLPEDKKSWKPHEKSMSIDSMAKHIVGLQTWFGGSFKNSSFDLLTDSKTIEYSSFHELSQFLERGVNQNLDYIKSVDESFWNEEFTFRKGDYVILKAPRKDFIHAMLTNHFIHHRGQLSVYLRLLNIPVPGVYGPSADER